MKREKRPIAASERIDAPGRPRAVRAQAPVADTTGPSRNPVVQAFRQLQAQGGPDYARGEMIQTLASCIIFAIELDGPSSTIRLLGDTVIALQSGAADELAARMATHH